MASSWENWEHIQQLDGDSSTEEIKGVVEMLQDAEARKHLADIVQRTGVACMPMYDRYYKERTPYAYLGSLVLPRDSSESYVTMFGSWPQLLLQEPSQLAHAMHVAPGGDLPISTLYPPYLEQLRQEGITLAKPGEIPLSPLSQAIIDHARQAATELLRECDALYQHGYGIAASNAFPFLKNLLHRSRANLPGKLADVQAIYRLINTRLAKTMHRHHHFALTGKEYADELDEVRKNRFSHLRRRVDRIREDIEDLIGPIPK